MPIFANVDCMLKTIPTADKNISDLLDGNHDEMKSIAVCKAVSLVAGEPTRDSPGLPKIENEVDIKSYQQDWKNLPHHLGYRQDENSLQHLVSRIRQKQEIQLSGTNILPYVA